MEGNPPTEKIQEILQHLKDILHISEEEIQKRTKTHPAAFTIEQWKPHTIDLYPSGIMCKNLFLKDKKKGYY